MSILNFWQVNAFANKPFTGNPAAVFIIDRALKDDVMQKIAMELNQPETAFVLIRDNMPPLLRWFTPTFEIDLCGHATLASAHILMNEVNIKESEVTFDTNFVGPLNVTKDLNGYTMDLPSRPGNKVNLNEIPKFVLDSISPNNMPLEAYKSRDLMLVYDRDEFIKNMTPDFKNLEKHDEFIIVTAKSETPKYDFISRFFSPSDDVPEDPVTGSAHCTLAPYWSNKLSKTNLKAFQASKRGGELIINYNNDRVLISGAAITTVKASLLI